MIYFTNGDNSFSTVAIASFTTGSFAVSLIASPTCSIFSSTTSLFSLIFLSTLAVNSIFSIFSSTALGSGKELSPPPPPEEPPSLIKKFHIFFSTIETATTAAIIKAKTPTPIASKDAL